MANRLKGRFGYPVYDPFKLTFHPERLSEPLQWKKPQRIFVVSMGDLFHEDVKRDWIDAAWSTMAEARQHTFQVLTKRPDRMREFMVDRKRKGWKADWANIHLGVTAENQPTADERIPILLQIPAAKRFVSVEPMLGPVDLLRMHQSAWEGTSRRPMVDWIICGGETGPGARPMNPDWARSLRDQCQAAGLPFFFKQMSGKQTIPKDLMIREFPE
jgi:protein gp37